MQNRIVEQFQIFRRPRWAAGAVLVLLAGSALYGFVNWRTAKGGHSEVSSQSRKGSLTRYFPSQAEWASLSIQPVVEKAFRAEHVTEGKIAIDEDRSTPVFSPYAGRVTRLLSRPGDMVAKGQSLFVIEAPDTVQAQNDFIAAMTAMNKAKSALALAEIQNKRASDLFEGKAVPLKDFQQAQATLIQAQNDMRSSQTALEASRNKLKILGLSDDDIASFQDKGRINPETTIFAPIGGTVVQRKVGPGQYVNSGASDPVYVIGDLSTVWLVAYVRESDAMKIKLGQDIRFTVLAQPGKTFRAKIDYVATAIDPVSRRRMVRTAIPNADGLLAPEMFATVSIVVGEDKGAMAAVPRGAVIYEGNSARLWVVHDDQSLELRSVKLGLSDGELIQVVEGLGVNEKVITRGSLFIDRLAARSQS